MNQNLSEPRNLKILIVDSHELILDVTINVVQKQYPEGEISIAQNAQSALHQIEKFQPQLVIMELSLPESCGQYPHIETGIQCLRTVMKKYPQLNLIIFSSYTKALVRIQTDKIYAHEGGFAVIDKSLPRQEMLNSLDVVLKGGKVYPGRKTREVNYNWLELLNLAFQEGLTDQVIAQRMNVAQRTVRHYWSQLQAFLGIDPRQSREEGKNIRIQTLIYAREAGFID